MIARVPLSEEDLGRALVDVVERLAPDYEATLGLPRIIAAVRSGRDTYRAEARGFAGEPRDIIERVARDELGTRTAGVPTQPTAGPPGRPPDTRSP